MRIDEIPFACESEKEKKEGLRISTIALLLVVFKWHHGSQRVKHVKLHIPAYKRLTGKSLDSSGGFTAK